MRVKFLAKWTPNQVVQFAIFFLPDRWRSRLQTLILGHLRILKRLQKIARYMICTIHKHFYTDVPFLYSNIKIPSLVVILLTRPTQHNMMKTQPCFLPKTLPMLRNSETNRCGDPWGLALFRPTYGGMFWKQHTRNTTPTTKNAPQNAQCDRPCIYSK